MSKLFRHPFFIRLMHWEYWNSRFVYAPVFPYWLWLSLKARSFYFLTAANPRIKNGGYIMESKMDVYSLLPSHFYPRTLFFKPGGSFTELLDAVRAAGITYPLFAKPDIGERGMGVKKIDDEAQLREYALHIPVPFLVQEFIPYEKEAGIFYCKPPGTQKGFISGIVNKEPVTVTGDGISTLAMLVRSNDRYYLQWKQITAMYPHLLDQVIEKGRYIVLVPYGNHCRGSKFTDETFRVNSRLTDAIDQICSRIPEFYYGRLDIRFRDWESLERAENFSIIEVNGSGSEPTHIYDPAHSIFFAWKEIIRHWDLLYRISKANNKKGVPYITLAEGRREMNSFRAIDEQLSVRHW